MSVFGLHGFRYLAFSLKLIVCQRFTEDATLADILIFDKSILTPFSLPKNSGWL